MRMGYRIMLAASGIAVGLGLGGLANAAATDDDRQRVWKEIDQVAKVGPVDVTLIDQAVLHVPAGQRYVPQPAADHLFTMWGNPIQDKDMLGALLPTDDAANWATSVDYLKAGFVKDKDADDWKPDALLQSVREGTEEANKERAKAGETGLEIVGWAQKPAYDSARQRLVWAISSRPAGAPANAPQDVNYNTYALGRDGYFNLTMITSMAELPSLKPVAEQQLAGLDYVSGKRYADFDEKTDHVAEYGLAALVVGVAAHKLGLIAIIGVFLAKFAKLIFVGLAVFGSGVAKFFKRK